jgi:hypothetical protein
MDDHELRELEADLRKAPLRAQLGAARAIGESAEIVHTRMKRAARGHRQLPKFARSVTWEMRGPFSAEVGHETTRGTQGRLAHILLYGSVNNAPIYDYRTALYRSIPQIERKFADMGEDAVLGGPR